MWQLSANTNVRCFYVRVSSSPSNKIICSFLVHFLLLLAIENLNVNDNMIHKLGQVSKSIIIGYFDVDVSTSPSNKTICSFFGTFHLKGGCWDLECKWRYDFLRWQLSANTSKCFNVGVSSSHSNKTICSFLVHFLLLLATETLNVKLCLHWACFWPRWWAKFRPSPLLKDCARIARLDMLCMKRLCSTVPRRNLQNGTETADMYTPFSLVWPEVWRSTAKHGDYV